MKNLYDSVMQPYVIQQRKHGVDAAAEVNKLTNEELLQLISDYLEVKEQHTKGDGPL